MKLASFLLSAVLVLGASLPASAGEFAVLKAEVAGARKVLMEMAVNREKRGFDQQKRVKDTADAVSSHLGKLKAPPAKAAEFMELKEIWEAFKRTRERELVPAILANDQEKYAKIGAGIQKQRLDRMYELLDALDK